MRPAGFELPKDLQKKCPKCSAVHSRGDWERLPYCGPQGDPEFMLELRHCLCGSTIAVVLERSPALECA